MVSTSSSTTLAIRKDEQQIAVAVIAELIVIDDPGIARLCIQGRAEQIVGIKVGYTIIILVAVVGVTDIDRVQLLVAVAVVDRKGQLAVIQIIRAIIKDVDGHAGICDAVDADHTDIRDVAVEGDISVNEVAAAIVIEDDQVISLSLEPYRSRSKISYSPASRSPMSSYSSSKSS